MVDTKVQTTMRVGTRVLQAGSGPPLVFVHGVGMSADYWRPQLEAFATDFTVLTYDILGHGKSGLPPPSPTLAHYAAQLHAVTDPVGPAIVVGHSMGALIALEYALSQPERVVKVVAMNAVFCRTAKQLAAVQARALDLEGGRSAAGREQTLARWFGSPIPAELSPAARWVDSALQTVDALGYARTYRLFATSDTAHRGRLSMLDIPALFLTGELDSNSSPSMARAMASETRDGIAVILPAQRHMMSLAAPDLVNDVVRRFIATDRYQDDPDSWISPDPASV